MTGAATLRFTKMHGAGNDFVVLDLRGGRPAPTPALARALGNRHTGVGFDQLLTIEDPAQAGALARYRIWNADGSAAQQCGNGARCVAAWLQRDGAARDTYRFTHGGQDVTFGIASMGNPHAVIEVPDVAAADVAGLGPALQARDEFPEGVNVGFAQVLAPDRIRLRVFERGAGETLACGSGACAAVAVLARRGRIGRHVFVELPGGTLEITWPGDDSPVTMAGPTAFVFEGDFLLEQTQ